MRKYIIVAVVLLVIGLAPYVDAVFSYRGAGGSVGSVNGVQYDYIFVDQTHFQNPKVLIYPEDHVSSFGSGKLTIWINGNDMEFGEDKVLLLKPDKSIVRLGWNKEWFVTSSDYSSEIYGILGPVPHFKDYQIEYPDREQFRILIEQHAHNNAMHTDADRPRR